MIPSGYWVTEPNALKDQVLPAGINVFESIEKIIEKIL